MKEALPKFPKDGGGEQAPIECIRVAFKFEANMSRKEVVIVIVGDTTIETNSLREAPLVARSATKTKDLE